MRPRLLRLFGLTVSGLVIACLGAMALGGPASAIDTSAGTPSFWPPGIRVEPLALGLLGLPAIATAPGTGLATGAQTDVNLMRITYAPSAALDFHWPGWVMYYIDQGTLTVQLGGHAGIESHGQGPGPFSSQNFAVSRDAPVAVPAGQAIIATDGYVGATRNGGTTPAVVLVVTVITQQMTSVHHHESVTVPLGPATPTP